MTRSSAFRLATAREGATTVVAAVGTLDIATVGQLESVVTEALAQDSPVVLDLSEVSMCDSTGLGAMVRLFRQAQAVGQPFTLRNPRRHVADVLAMTGINKVVPVSVTP
jgi:anti-sigma B factor antagonist